MRNHAAHALILAALLLPCAGNISAQVPTAFDDTSITPANKNVGKLLEPSFDTIAGAQVTLLDLLRLKYGFSPRIVGLTNQQETTRFDVISKIDPPGVADPMHNPKAQAFLLDALLRNHFHLKAHEAQLDVVTEQLFAPSDPTKLTPSPPSCSCSRTTTATSNHLKSERISMAGLAKELSKQVGVEVSDRTKLRGTYTIDLDWSPDSGASPQTPEERLRHALKTQLDLTLLPTHKQEKAIVIDYIELPANVIWVQPNPDSPQTALSSSH